MRIAVAVCVHVVLVFEKVKTRIVRAERICNVFHKTVFLGATLTNLVIAFFELDSVVYVTHLPIVHVCAVETLIVAQCGIHFDVSLACFVKSLVLEALAPHHAHGVLQVEFVVGKRHLIVDIRVVRARVLQHKREPDKLLAVHLAKLHLVRRQHLLHFRNRVQRLSAVHLVVGHVPHMLRTVGVEIRRPILVVNGQRYRLFAIVAACRDTHVVLLDEKQHHVHNARNDKRKHEQDQHHALELATAFFSLHLFGRNYRVFPLLFQLGLRLLRVTGGFARFGRLLVLAVFNGLLCGLLADLLVVDRLLGLQIFLFVFAHLFG